MPSPPRTTAPMMLVLANLIEGRNPWSHLTSNAERGSCEGTRRALLRRGWVAEDEDRTMTITEAGRAAFARTTPPPQNPERRIEKYVDTILSSAAFCGQAEG